jgi:hypothetical protein
MPYVMGKTRAFSTEVAKAAPATAPASQITHGFWIDPGVRRINATSDCRTWSTIHRNQSSPGAIPPSSSFFDE